ncbi:hypothetical protein [Aeromicrobium sp. NPDC092404]|uniref:hypothetical protein n=1 Tax=Aeromicrobium sp. NPDC092404 TaxID=3154976 RepID=UPI003413F86D
MFVCHTLSRLTTALAVSLMAAGTLVATTAPATAAWSPNVMVISPAAPMANEVFATKGRLSTAFERPVKLQRLKSYRDQTWETVHTAVSDSAGYFYLSGRTSADRSFRVYAPTVKHKGRTYARIVTPTKVVRVAVQKVTLTVSSKVWFPYQPATVTLQATPARPGRAMYLFASTSSHIDTTGMPAQASTQDSRGRATFTFTPDSDEVGLHIFLLGKAMAWDGAAPTSSAALEADIVAPKP